MTKKTKMTVLDTKEKIVTKLENIKPKQLVFQEDMVKILDGVYNNVLNGLGKVVHLLKILQKIIYKKKKNQVTWQKK